MTNRRGQGRKDSEVIEKLDAILDLISSGNERLERLELMIVGSDRRAEKRSQREIGIEKMLTKTMIERMVGLQASLTNAREANEGLITKMIAEIRKAGNESEHEMPPEVDAVLNGIEANIGALAAATAAGTEAVPATVEIPPVVEPPVGGSEGGAQQE